MSALRVREATEEDVPAIVGLYGEDEIHGRNDQSSGPMEPYLRAFHTIRADPNNRVYVAELDGAVVGTFQLTFIQQLTAVGSLVAQVESVFVAETHRSAGVGTTMMRWAIEAARARNCRRIQLTSNVARPRAHAFYERLGFVASHRGMKLQLTL